MSVQAAPSAPAASPTVQEFSIRVPKNVKKKYQVMRFTSSVNMEFNKWSQVKMERENNMREFKGNEEEVPKYGAGSEFGRDAREEARRKKYGIVSKKYRPDDQPWILKVGGKTGKKFRGIREGGVAENAAYYVFTHSPDGGIDAFPLTEWYNFQPIQRYKALTAEEAEEEFGRRNKNWNLFSLMMRKRLNGGEEVEGEEPEEGKGKKSSLKKKELKISDMDDWMDSDDDSGSNSNSDDEKKDKEENANKNKDKKGAKKGALAKKKKKKASDDEAFEESDDGDEEGREVDYISDSSESESDHEGKVNKQLQGVAEEDALRKLLSSGEEDEDEEKKEEADKESETEDKEKAKTDADKAVDKEKKSGTNSAKKLKKKKLKKVKKEEGNSKQQAETSSDFSSDSSDSDSDGKKKQKDSGKGSKEANSAGSSRSGTPTKDVAGGAPAAPEKRKAAAILELNAAKKARLDNFSSATLAPYTGDSRITEDAVRRYLMRKPMTTTELLQKFKSKKTGLTSDQLVNVMTQILKRINPVKQMIKDKMYLSIKA